MDLYTNSIEFSNLKKGTTGQIRLRFFSSFCDGNFLKPHYEEVFESHLLDYYGPEKKLYITNEDDYTHVVIFNLAMPVLKPDIPKENVVGLSFEPIYFLGLTVGFVEYAKKYISRYFIGDKKNLSSPFFEGYAYMCHTVPLTYLPEKNKLMSIMVSEKGFAPGHKYRYELAIAILKTGLPIDIYGRGCANFKKNMNYTDKRLKGEFTDKEPYENYLFHICIENFKCNEYFSEKILNPLLCSTTPVYLGCRNIKNYFGNDPIYLTGNLEVDMNMFTLILKEPMKHYRRLDIEKIKNTTNFLRNVDKVFSLQPDGN
jgi:hypothetical protein